MLDEAGFTDVRIFASSDLDEETISSLQAQGAKIDVWGVGTKLITAYDQPALGAVYKLVSVEDEHGEVVDTIKISSNPEKVTTPGKKKVYRIINNFTRRSEGDYITLENENPNEEKRINMFHPIHTYLSKDVTDFEAENLHYDIFVEGSLIYTSPKIQEIRKFSRERLHIFWEEYKRKINPEDYPVDLSMETWEHKMNSIKRIRENIGKNLE